MPILRNSGWFVIAGYSFQLTFSIFCLFSVFVMTGIGTWQLYRLEWKQGLIDQFEARINAPTVQITSLDLVRKDDQYRRIKLKGTFDKDHYFRVVNRSREGQPGLHILVPFHTELGSLLVDIGFVPFDDRDKFVLNEERQEVTGIVNYSGARTLFSPDNDVKNNSWYEIDPIQKGQAVGQEFARWHLIDSYERGIDELPRGRQWKYNIANNHLQYAITWYLLALGAFGVFFAFHWQRWQEEYANRTSNKVE